MADLSADVAAVERFGATAAALGADLTAAGAGAASAGPALLTPVFGLIGGDFLAAFAAAHGGHVAAISELARVYDSLGTTATANAAGYSATEQAGTAALRTVEDGVA